MNKLALFALLVVCGSVISQDCSTLTTEAACNDNTDCAYATTGGSCANKCTSLTTTTCTDATNGTNCEAVVGNCSVPVDCTTLAASQTNCEAQQANCSYTAATSASCALKGTALETTCNGLTADKATCEADPAQCSFTASTFKDCTYKTGECTKQTAGNCNSSYCDETAFVCVALATSECSSLLQAACLGNDAASQGCSWTNGACVDTCASKNNTDCDADTTNCETKTPYACADKSSGDSCGAQTTDTACNAVSTFCTTNTNAATCTALATFCTAKSATDCAADTTNCEATPEKAATCVNKVAAATCTNVTDETTCGTTTGCQWNAWKCQNKAGTSCTATDSATDCAATTKYCTYTATGTCATKSYSAVLAAAGSLLVTLALL